MLFVLHGENIIRSRNAVLGLKGKLGMEKLEFPIGEISAEQLLDTCLSFDIFGTPPFIILNISNAGRMQVTSYVAILSRIPNEAVLVVLAGKTLPKTNPFLKEVEKLGGKIIVSSEKPQSNIFKFLDSVFSRDRTTAYTELRDLLLDDEDPFKLFSMLLYALRNVASAKFIAPNFEKQAPFVRQKSRRQADNFSEHAISNLFKIFYDLDVKSKLGEIPKDILVPLALEEVFKACV